jgi:uncharacterized caspase-like protein
MRKCALRWLLLAVAMAVTGPGFAQPGTAESKVALVIGNAAYPSAQLRNPANDAKAMAGKLRALGFAVDLRTDVGLREMTRAISQFGRLLKPGSVGLFYFAGHGVQVRGKNFLIPVDAEIDTEAAVRSEAVDVDQVLEQLGPARLSMVILDACRNNPFERRFRAIGGGGGLAQIDAPTGSLLAYATAPGKVAADGNGPHGLYTAELLTAMDVPGLKIEDVFKQVRINVLKASNNQQTPWEASSLTGEFYFRQDSPKAVDDGRLKQAEREQTELRRAVEDERKKREQDAEAMKRQLAELQAELARVRQAAAPPPAKAPASVSSGATTTVAAANPGPRQYEEKPPVSAAPVSASPPAPPAGSTLEEQLARMDRERDDDARAIAATLVSRSADTARPVPVAAVKRGEWGERIDLLEKSRTQLTYAKAIALLFDISAEKDLHVVIETDQALRRMAWHSAYAVGLNATGYLAQGYAWRNQRPQAGEQTAITNCESKIARPCKAIMVDGEFRAGDFIDVAKGFGGDGPSVAKARAAYLQSIAALLKLNRF